MLQIYLPAIMALFVTLLSAKRESFLEAKKVILDDNRSDKVLADRNYRLQTELSVMDYRVNLTFPEQSLTLASDQFTGKVSIIFQLSSKVNWIQIHASKKHLTLTKVLLANVDVTSKISDGDWDADTDLLKLTIARGLNIDTNLTLDIEYTGTFSTTGQGLYKRSFFNSNDETQYLIYSQLKPVYAREVFPCFDEPHLKAEFYFNITLPNNMKVFFNTPLEQSEVSSLNNAETWHAFQRTPVMSTYLIAFVISKDLECTSGANLDDSAKFEVCSRTEVKSSLAFALEQAPKIVAKLEDITGLKYSENMQKLSLVAIPNEQANPTENWGVITAAETVLLYKDDLTTTNQKQLKERVLARKIAQQWFGNLVTSKWWSETFLSEGFANYFEYMILNEIYADWDISKQFVVAVVQASLEADSQNDVLALQSSVETSEDILNKFDFISSFKGASITHMVSNIMGGDNFQNGIKKYLENKKNNNAEASDLWTALQGSVNTAISNLPSKVTLTGVMQNWIALPGYPLLTVSLVDQNIKIVQERFLSSGEDKTSKWFVPISYTTSSSTSKFTSTNPSQWLKPDDESLTLKMGDSDSWIILNNQQSAYYRVNYDKALWKKIAEALEKSDFDGIHELNRAQIVDDVFALYKINKLSFKETLTLINFLKNEVSLSVWSSAISNIDYINNRISQPDLKEKYQAYIQTQIETFYNSFPLNVDKDSHLYSITQELAAVACRYGNENCIKRAREAFSSFTNSKTPLEKVGTEFVGQSQHAVANLVAASSFSKSGLALADFERIMLTTFGKLEPFLNKLSKDFKNIKSVVYCTGIRNSNSGSDWDTLWDVFTQESDSQERLMYLTALGCTNDLRLQKKYLLKVLDSNSKVKLSEAQTVFNAVYTGSSTGLGTALGFLLEKFEDINEKLGSSVASSIVTGLSGSINKNLEIEKLKKFMESKDDLPEEFKKAVDTANANIEWMKTHSAEIYEYFNVTQTDEEDDEYDSSALISQPTFWILILSFIIRFFN